MEIINTHKCFTYKYITSVFLLCFAHFYTVTSDTVENKMIIDAINYCDALNILRESSYMAKCREIPFPRNFKDNDIDLALCMMVFDTMNKICQNIVNKEYTIKLPETVKELDNDIRKLEPKSKDYKSFIANLCKRMITVFNSWNSLGVQSDPNAIPYIKYVAETLFEQHECGYTCHKPNDTVNPLCIIFLWFNETLTTAKRFKAMPPSNKNLENSAIASDIVAQKELSTLENNGYVNSKQFKFEKIDEHTSPLNKVSTKQPSENSLPSSASKIPDDSKMKYVDPSSAHNEYELKKDSEIYKVEERRKDGATLSLNDKVNDKASITTYKPSENLMDNPNNIIPQDDINSDKVLVSSEDHQNKKINEIKDEDGDEHDNVNDLKESIINTEDEMFSSRNSGIQQGLIHDGKAYPHSSIIKEEDESHFFTYFSIITLICIGLYIGYHNKQKILAIVLEGRRSRRGRGSRRRPSTASYHKLDCNLEEAVTSQCNSNVTHVIY